MALWIAFLEKILYFWVRSSNNLKVQPFTLDENDEVYYTMNIRSFLDTLVIKHECKKQNLPSPTAPNNILKKISRLIFLKSRKSRLIGLKRKLITNTNALEPIVAFGLHDMLSTSSDKNTTKKNIIIIPVSLFWGRKPDKEHSVWKIILSDNWSVPGALKKLLMVIFHGKSVYVEYGTPITLNKIISPQDNLYKNTKKLTRLLGLQIKHTKLSVIGPDLSHTRTLAEHIILSKNVQNVIQEENTAKSRAKATEKARKYAIEIFADYSYSIITLFDKALKWLWNNLYDGVELYNIKAAKQATEKYAVIYTPCHRSHIDYLLLSYVLYQQGMAPPHIAAGINLNIPFIGTLLRRAGAFFIRRSFNNNKLYSTVFNEYLFHMIRKGFPLEYFIEGGRSRTGKMLTPKLGMLSMTARNYLRSPELPLAFVPVYVGYEKIFEGSSYLNELSGKKKKKESLFGLFHSFKGIKKNFGKVHVRFGEAITLDHILSTYNTEWKECDPSKVVEQDWFRKSIDHLASDLALSINENAIINPVNIVSFTLLSTPKHALDEQTLNNHIQLLIDLVDSLPNKQITLANDINLIPSSRYAEKQGVIERREHPLGDLMFIPKKHSLSSTYFSNNILHIYAVPSLIACFIINQRTCTFDELMNFIRTLTPFINTELKIAHDNRNIERTIIELLYFFNRRLFLYVNFEEKTIACPKPSSEEYLSLSILAGALKQTIERYFITLSILNKQNSGTLNIKQLEEQCQMMAQRVAFLYDVESPDFYDKRAFSNFINLLVTMHAIDIDKETQKIKYNYLLTEVQEVARLGLSEDIRRSIKNVTNSGEQ